MAKGDFADVGGNYDETLLQQGKYGEWFWLNMSTHARSFLRAAKNWESDNATFKCYWCKQEKPALEFTKSTVKSGGGHHRKCNTCSLNRSKTQGEPRRFENNLPDRWMDQAVCKEADPEVFFPVDADAYRRPDAPWRQFCPACPVAELCEKFGYDSHSVGVFGGKLFLERGSRSIRQVDAATPGRGRPRKDS